MNYPPKFLSSPSSIWPSTVNATGNLRKNRGLTLVEVIVAMSLLVLIMVGVMAAVIQAYRLASEVRIRNEVRFVLRSMSDQFSRTTFSSTNPLFTITTLPTGSGLSWRKDNKVFSLKPSSANDNDYIDGTSTGLIVPIASSSGSPINVTFTRWTRSVNPSNGSVSTSAPTGTAGGYLLKGDFTARFTIAGRPLTQTFTIVRAVP